jgi:hypothetical protein
MLSQELARALSLYGIHVQAAYDGDEDEDGDVVIACNVHVQVPTFSEAPRVVVNALRGPFRCYPPRSTLAELALDLRCALDDVPSACASSSLH